MIRADHTEPTAYALAIARNTHAWDNWLRLMSRTRDAMCGIESPRCKDCGQRIAPDLSCKCFEPIEESKS